MICLEERVMMINRMINQEMNKESTQEKMLKTINHVKESNRNPHKSLCQKENSPIRNNDKKKFKTCKLQEIGRILN
jgi:hypothetical protein